MDTDKIIHHLKKEIKERDKDIHQAALYGKQLYEENVELKSKYDDLLIEKEVFQQENYSLQLQLESSSKTINSLTSECELQRIRADELVKKLKTIEKENETMNMKIKNLIKENQYFKSNQEDLAVENSSLKERISLQHKEIKNFQEQAEKSLCETENDENSELQSQLQTYMLNNKELKETLTATQYQLEASKRNVNHLMQMVKDLEEAVQEKDTEIRTNAAETKKLKEDMEELQAEVELVKFDQIDTNRRGNSVFAELDDRRNLVEREYKKLSHKFELFKLNYEENKVELDQARGQIAILQSKTSRAYQQTYIESLEKSLSLAKEEVRELTQKLSKMRKTNVGLNDQEMYTSQRNEYSYLRLMLSQSQQRENELQNEAMDLRMKIISEHENFEKTQNQLYKSKQHLDLAKQEIVELNLKLRDLERGCVQILHTDNETSKPNVEYLDGFKPGKEKGRADSTCPNFLDETMFPGELELDENGFRQIKPARKSNKFVLQEFNRIEMEKTNKTDEKICDAKTSGTEIKDQRNSQWGRHQNVSKNVAEIQSSKKFDNCAQQ